MRVWFANRRQKEKKQGAGGGEEEQGKGQKSPETFLEDLYNTFRANDNPEEFDDQISDFEQNLPEETQRPGLQRSVIVASPACSPSNIEPGLYSLQSRI